MSNQDVILAGEIIADEIKSGNYADLNTEELVQLIIKEFSGLLIEFSEQPYVHEYDPDIDDVPGDNIPW